MAAVNVSRIISGSKNMKIKVLLLLFSCFLWHQKIFAQATTGNIEGWVFNEMHQPVSAANIILSLPDLQRNIGTVSDERGCFQITALPVGDYTAVISHVSYQRMLVGNIHVLLGKTISIGIIYLKERAVETSPVLVSGDRTFLDTRSTSGRKTLTAQQFDNLPIERNYFQIAELLPRANQSFKGDGGTNFSGSTGIENRFFIDGAEITSPTFGGVMFDLPNNFIREVEIRTGGYQAEYESSLGGIINAVTFSRGNKFQGKIFGYLTNNNFSGTPRLSAGQPPTGGYSNFDLGFGFGGPLIKDRLWYFAAYDPNSISEDVNVKGLGLQKSYFIKHKFAGKLSWNVNKDNFMSFSICGSPQNGRDISGVGELAVQNPEYCAENVSLLTFSSVIKGLHKLSGAFMLESSLSFGMQSSILKPTSAEGSMPWFDDYVTGTSSGGLGFENNKSGTYEYNASVKGTLTIRSHIVKAGIALAVNAATRDVKMKGLVHFPDAYFSYDIANQGTIKQNNFSAFIQDSWQISSRVILNAGVRWDPQWLIASDGSSAQRITNQVQPRFGVIYQPGDLGTQKISVSFGRFYQPLLLALSLAYHMKGSYFYLSSYPNDPRIDTSGMSRSNNFNPFIKNVPGVKGQYYDEFTLGYERIIFTNIKAGVSGVYRTLGQGVEDGAVSAENQIKYGSRDVYGNPGSGVLSSLPKMKREYTALEIILERCSSSGFIFLLSYVLSKNWGNYDGLAETNDVTGGAGLGANISGQFELPERMINAEGLLPNDRTHVLKFSGSYFFNFGLETGIIFQWMSGTPLNEFGIVPGYGSSTFLKQRGTNGRTPSIWDLNFRFIFDVSNLLSEALPAKIILDVMHVAGQRTPVDYDQYHYLNAQQTYVNPNYMLPVLFQQPMSLRLGMEIDL